MNGNLDVIGNAIFANPYWVAVSINFASGIPYFIRANGGRHTATSVVRVTGQPTGVVQFDFPAHPQGANCFFNVAGVNCHVAQHVSVRTSTRFAVVMRNETTSATIDKEVHVFIMAY